MKWFNPNPTGDYLVANVRLFQVHHGECVSMRMLPGEHEGNQFTSEPEVHLSLRQADLLRSRTDVKSLRFVVTGRVHRCFNKGRLMAGLINAEEHLLLQMLESGIFQEELTSRTVMIAVDQVQRWLERNRKEEDWSKKEVVILFVNHAPVLSCFKDQGVETLDGR